MSKLARFDRTACKVLRDEIDLALGAVAEKYGISIQAGNAKFSDNNITFKLELATKSDDGNVMTKEAEDFKRYAIMLGLRPEILFTEFEFNNKRFQLIGYKPKSPKYPFLAKCTYTGQTYKLPEQGVLRVLKNA